VGKMFTAEEVAKAVIDGNEVALKQIETLCTRVAIAEFQRDQLVELAQEVRTSGNTRLANMAIATLARITNTSRA